MVNGFDFTTPQSIAPTAEANYLATTRRRTCRPASPTRFAAACSTPGENGPGQPPARADLDQHHAPRGLRLRHGRQDGDPRRLRGLLRLADLRPLQRGAAGLLAQTPIIASQNNGQTFIATLANPFPNGLLQPVGTAEGIMTNDGSSVGFPFVDDVKSPLCSPLLDRLPAHAARETSSWTSPTSAAGCSRFPVTVELNAVPAQYLSTSPVRDQDTINYLTFQVANPLFGIPQVTAGMTGQRVNREQLLRPYPQFTSITSQESTGKRWYDAVPEPKSSGGSATASASRRPTPTRARWKRPAT